MTISETMAKYMPNDESLEQMTDFFNVFGDLTRIKIISLLSIREMSVGQLTELMNANQSTISHQLKVLKDNNIVAFRREKKKLIYFINNRYVEEIMLTCALALG